MPYGNPGGYRKGAPKRRAGGSNAALVTALQSVLQRFGGGRAAPKKGARAAARTKAHRVGDAMGMNESFEDSDYSRAGQMRIGHRR